MVEVRNIAMEDLPLSGTDHILIQPVPTGKFAVHGVVRFGSRLMPIGPIVLDGAEKAVNTAMSLAEQHGVPVVYVASRTRA